VLAAGLAGGLVVGLDRLPPGTPARVTGLLAPSEPLRLRLLALGFLPGSDIVVEQGPPCIVVSVGPARFGLDRRLAAQVAVVPSKNPRPKQEKRGWAAYMRLFTQRWMR